MKLVGFGCSFTYGSELIAPDDTHWTAYRNEHCWLGQLAKYFNCKFDNLAEPANSNHAIQHQVADYIRNRLDPQEQIIICVGWTSPERMSWYDDHWTHNGFVDRKHGWTQSAKEWVMRTGHDPKSHNMFTENAKLFVNSVCKNYNITILQFNALGQHKTTVYENYYADGYTMDSMLKLAEQEDSSKILFASDGHPNEQGHKYFAKRLHLFAKERIIL